MRRLRVYADTSVFGGCFDEEFAEITGRSFDEVRQGRFRLVVSTTTLRELQRAPEEVRQVVESIPETSIETFEVDEEVTALRDAYIQSGVVGPASLLDAEHMAAVADVDLIVSWNFKHIVNFQKIRGYHAVNLLRGYRQIPIHSPWEVAEP